MKVKFAACFLLCMLVYSCSTPKDVAYFQGLDSLTKEQLERMNQKYVLRIVPDDMLSIHVTSSDPQVVAPFNPPAYMPPSAPGTMSIGTERALHTYLVDNEGDILFPVLGKIRVAGLTKGEIAELIQDKLRETVADPMVEVRLLNYKVTLLGELLEPGTYEIQNDRMSILDALGLAGDLTINADRTNVLLVRDNDGQKEYGRLDLTDPAIFASPYYYLQQNDVIYVEPNAAKKKNSRYSQKEQFNITVISSILSVVSTVTTVVVALKK